MGLPTLAFVSSYSFPLCPPARLRGTCPGANNRLDVLSLSTSGLAPHESVRAGDLDAALEELQRAQWDDAELQDPDVPSVAHQRGTSTFVFVPFEQVGYWDTHTHA